jgi:hypothetical protein
MNEELEFTTLGQISQLIQAVVVDDWRDDISRRVSFWDHQFYTHGCFPK